MRAAPVQGRRPAADRRRRLVARAQPGRPAPARRPAADRRPGRAAARLAGRLRRRRRRAAPGRVDAAPRGGDPRRASSATRLPVPPSADEVARLGETLNEMLERLDRAFSRERRFVADASHELRTPLAILRGELELAARDATADPEIHDGDRLGHRGGRPVIQLAEDLLVIARSDERALPVRPEPIEARELLGRVAARFGARAGERDVELVVRAPDGLVLDADPLRLRAGRRQPRRQRPALRPRADRARGRGRTRPAHAARARRRRRASPRTSSRSPSSASPAVTRRAAGAAPGWDWRSCRPSRWPTAGRPIARNRAAGGAEVALELPFPAPAREGPPPKPRTLIFGS